MEWIIEMEGQSWLCSICSHANASMFCTCTGSEVLLCVACVGTHFQKTRGKHHVTYDIQDRPYFRIPCYLEHRNAREEVFPTVKESVLASAREVEKCIEEYCTRVDQVIAALGKLKTETVEMLKGKKAEIERSLEEVEATLANPQPELNTPHGKSIRKAVDSNSADIQLFTYTLTVGSLESLLTVNISQNTKLSIDKYPGICGNLLRLYDLQSRLTTSFTLSTTFTKGTSFCLLDSANVLCLGGLPPSNRVYRLNIHTQKMVLQPCLDTARSYLGVVNVGMFVYVFGSFNPNLASCEKFSLQSQVWSNLPNMNAPRFGFNPAALLNDIYLADSQGGNRSIQVFNLVQDSFRTLPISIPTQWAYNTHAFIVDGELCLLAQGHIGKWRIGSSLEVVVRPISGAVGLSNTPACVMGDEVFLVEYNTGALVRFNYRTNSVVT